MVPVGPGHAAGLKVSALVAVVVTGADSVLHMAVLQRGAMPKLLTGCAHRQDWAPFCGRSGSAMFGSWMRSRPGS